MIKNKKDDKYFMKQAIKEAEKARKKEEVPIGAVLVLEDKIISRGHNLRETKTNPLYHAEIIAVDKASKKLKKWRLRGTKLYVTIEPCPMCIGAAINARIKEVVYGAPDPKAGACKSIMNIPFNKKLNHKVKVKKGILEKECREIIQKFFKELRKKGKK
ncbi:MAG: tRNA adenosine(34) deaminase TadA [Armatimonadota bacterium]